MSMEHHITRTQVTAEEVKKAVAAAKNLNGIPIHERELTNNAQKMDRYIGLADVAQFMSTFAERREEPAEILRNRAELRELHKRRQLEEQKPLEYSSDEDFVGEVEGEVEAVPDFFIGRVDENARILTAQDIAEKAELSNEE